VLYNGVLSSDIKYNDILAHLCLHGLVLGVQLLPLLPRLLLHIGQLLLRLLKLLLHLLLHLVGGR
jgi:hypothetical protein